MRFETELAQHDDVHVILLAGNHEQAVLLGEWHMDGIGKDAFHHFFFSDMHEMFTFTDLVPLMAYMSC